MRWLLARLKEASTWRGIIWMLAAFGLSLRPDQAEAIVMAGMALAGLFGVFLPDEAKKTRNELPPIELQSRPESMDTNCGVGTVQSADRVRQSVPSRPASTDPNTYPRLNAGFGDRD